VRSADSSATHDGRSQSWTLSVSGSGFLLMIHDLPVRALRPCSAYVCCYSSVAPEHQLVESTDLVISNSTDYVVETCLGFNFVWLGDFPSVT
jgi:hypothetical protein